MQIRFNCPSEGCVALVELEPLEGAGESIRCPRCGVAHPVRVSETMLREQVIDACPLCGCREMFVRKDFPQRLGLAIVVVAAAISVLTFRTNVLLSWGVLAAAVLVDFVIYRLVGTVTVCYACRAEMRGFRMNSAHEGFDLARSEKF